jgi:NADPH-dependent ferric siderophore reductase
MSRPERPRTDLVVTATERLSPGMIRVRFAAADRSAFAERFSGSRFTDRYVKLVLTDPAGQEALRTYTALDPDVADGTLAIDFVVHGTEGLAGPWAAAASPGDRLSALGPGGAYAPDTTADWHLLASDESGLPALRAALAALPADAIGYAVVEVPDESHVQPLPAPADVEVRWVVGDASGATEPLAAAVRALPWLPGRVHAFVHGEAGAVMHGIRPYLLKERAVPREDVSVSGYWRKGRTEEAFRQWKAELAAAEGAA